jgi:hypothetical protein
MSHHKCIIHLIKFYLIKKLLSSFMSPFHYLKIIPFNIYWKLLIQTKLFSTNGFRVLQRGRLGAVRSWRGNDLNSIVIEFK